MKKPAVTGEGEEGAWGVAKERSIKAITSENHKTRSTRTDVTDSEILDTMIHLNAREAEFKVDEKMF